MPCSPVFRTAAPIRPPRRTSSGRVESPGQIRPAFDRLGGTGARLCASGEGQRGRGEREEQKCGRRLHQRIHQVLTLRARRSPVTSRPPHSDDVQKRGLVRPALTTGAIRSRAEARTTMKRLRRRPPERIRSDQTIAPRGSRIGAGPRGCAPEPPRPRSQRHEFAASDAACSFARAPRPSPVR
jgi:hypothetical protein